MNDSVLILAAGTNSRWPVDAPPKELALICGEPILARTVRLVDAFGFVPTLVTQRNALSLTARNWNPNVSLVTVSNPLPRRSKSECLLTLRDQWWGTTRTVVLLGDVVYTEALLQRVLSLTVPRARFYGTDLELYACQWSAHINAVMVACLERARAVGARTGQSRLWQLCHAWEGTGTANGWESFESVTDATRDVDTVGDYAKVKALWEMATVDS